MSDRDVLVPKHPRPQSQPGVPQFVDEECTGKYEGEELAAKRAKRPTDERIAKLEAKHDKLTEAVGGVKEAVAGMASKLDTAIEFIKLTHGETHKTERTRLTSRGKMIASIVGAVCLAAGTIVTAILAGACS